MKRKINLKIKSKSIESIRCIKKFKNKYIDYIDIEEICIQFGYVILNVTIHTKETNTNEIVLCKKLHRYLDNRDKKYIELVVA